MTVKREIEVRLAPSELAELFCNLCGDEQAHFFDYVGHNARDWPNSGWCVQSADIVKHLGPIGRATIATLAAHLDPEPGGWTEWAGGECPVLDCVRVDVRFRDGDIAENLDPAGWRWTRFDLNPRGESSGRDIVAYRVTGEKK